MRDSANKRSTLSYQTAEPTLAQRLERMAAGHQTQRAVYLDEERERRREFCVLGGIALLLLMLISGGYLAFVPRNTAATLPVAALAGDYPSATLPQSYPPQASSPALPLADKPLDWGELCLMLRTGLRDEEVIAAASGKQLVSAIGPVQVRALRQLGASARLISYLQNCPRFAALVTRYVSPVTNNAPPPTASQPEQASVVPVAASSSVTIDYAAKDREIQSLKGQIDALDERVRVIRNNPRGAPEWWHYCGPGNGWVNQAALARYLDQLDKERNDLRRSKWQLEGR